MRSEQIPVKQLARILLARRGNIGMGHHVRPRDVMPLHDLCQQRQQRGHLLIREGAIAELMTGIDQLDPHAGGIDIGDPAPVALAGMPGATILANQAVDRAILFDQIMRGDLRCLIAQPGECFVGTLHAGVVEHHH